jgi:hypothetical protein
MKFWVDDLDEAWDVLDYDAERSLTTDELCDVITASCHRICRGPDGGLRLCHEHIEGYGFFEDDDPELALKMKAASARSALRDARDEIAQRLLKPSDDGKESQSTAIK